MAGREVSERSKALQLKARQQAEEAVKVWAEKAEEARATDERTALLKGLRLDRERAEAMAAVAEPKPVRKTATRAKKVKA